MDITDTLYVSDRAAWRAWLEEHYKTSKEIWLVYYRQQSGKPRIPYHEAVEEALCFGWIDSTVKNLDDERFAQRFSPRKARSPYSQANRERLQRLLAQGKVKDEVRQTLGDLADEPFVIPPDILAALQANQEAWDNFQRFPASYQRIRIAYIAGARKRPAEFEKRLRNFIAKTAQNKKFGFGIEDYY